MSASFALALVAATAISAAPATSTSAPDEATSAAPVQVHGKTAFTVRTARGEMTAAARARRMGEVLRGVIEEKAQGPLGVELNGDEATFRLGERILFSLTAADAEAEGERSLERFAQQRKEQLDDFLRQERRRARLQHAVLGVSLVVFLGFASWLLIRQIRRWAASAQQWIAGSDAEESAGSRRLFADEKVRGLSVVLVRGAQFFSYAVVVYLFLVGSLSLFDRTKVVREQLTQWAMAPFMTVAERVSTGVPTLLLLFLMLVVVQAGWQAINLTSERIAAGRAHLGAVPPEFVPAVRLLLRIGLVLVSCLLVAPLLSGPSAELFSRLGWMVLEGLGLALLPLVANVAVGVHSILTRRYRTGEYLRLRDGGEGSVAGLDLLCVRLLDSSGEQVLVPHLLAMVQPLRRLSTPPGLEVELPVPVELGPQLALQLLEQTAAEFVAARCLAARAVVSVLEVGERHCRVRVSLPSCPQALRSDLLRALWGALPAAGAQAARSQARSA